MRTIKDYEGTEFSLSDQLYEITSDEHPSRWYKRGAKVRIISDPHFDKGYETVCRDDAEVAEFMGIKKTSLKPVPTTTEELK